MKWFVRIVLICIMAISCIGMSVSASAATLHWTKRSKKHTMRVEIAKDVTKETELDIFLLPLDKFKAWCPGSRRAT